MFAYLGFGTSCYHQKTGGASSKMQGGWVKRRRGVGTEEINEHGTIMGVQCSEQQRSVEKCIAWVQDWGKSGK
jgi:hypothetical protein